MPDPKTCQFFHFFTFSLSFIMKHYFFRGVTRRTHAFSMPVALLCALFLITGWRCEGQAPGQPVKSPPSAPETPKTPTQDIENWHSSGRFFGEEKDLPKGVISETQGNQYPSKVIHFHDDAGKKVKAIREDQFPIKNPLFKLPFPKNPKPHRYRYYLPLIELDDKTGEETLVRVSTVKKLKSFKSLNKYGLEVKEPESATDIIGNPHSSSRYMMSFSGKYFARVEDGSVFYKFAKEKHDSNGKTMSNSLLDCSYLSVYNHTGEVIQELLIPDKLLRSGWISDDGKYLFCQYNVGYIWDEGVSELEIGLLLIDLRTKEVILVDMPELKGYGSARSCSFKGGYFQVEWNEKNFIYLNPYTRTYYKVVYSEEDLKGKKRIDKPFMHYEGLGVDLSKYPKYTY